jgi:hypothetical protein
VPREKATDSLSAAGRAAMMRGFASGWPAARVVQAVRDETGETVAPRTIARRAAEWRAERERRRRAQENMEDLVAAADGSGKELSGVIRALALETLVRDPDALTSADPIKLNRLGLRSEELRIKARQQELKERELGLDERRVKLMEERERRALDALTDKAETLTPEERMQRIREIYGLGTS